MWRWIDTQYLDPLTFDSRSQIGVPDLFESWTSGGLTVANWPGVGVVEGRAFSAFLPRLAHVLLGQPLVLPNIATWWCGQEREADIVRDRFDELVIGSAFGRPVEGLPEGRSRAVASLKEDERKLLLDAMARRPMDYCGEEIVHLSTTPALIDDQLLPRPFTIRAFVARDADGNWAVMPGGFARLSSSGTLRSSLMMAGDLSADICIVDDIPVEQDSLLTSGVTPAIRRGGSILSSQAADNLFWFSRYSERAEITVRILRSLLGSSIDADSGPARDPAVVDRLVALLVQWGAVPAESAGLPLSQLCGQAFTGTAMPGSIAALIGSARGIGRSLRDRFTNDFWRIANRPVPFVDPNHAESMLKSANMLIERFSALSGLAAENMVRGPSWRFFDIGRRLERALNSCRIARRLANGLDQANALGALLDLTDSQIVYRSRYLTGPMREPVLDLVLLDPQNTRSLIYQLLVIEEHIGVLPTLGEDNIPERPLREARMILAPLQSATIDTLTDAQLQDIETRLLGLSDAISERYFLQYEKSDKPVQDNFLE